jgi:hypothetical protein
MPAVPPECWAPTNSAKASKVILSTSFLIIGKMKSADNSKTAF